MSADIVERLPLSFTDTPDYAEVRDVRGNLVALTTDPAFFTDLAERAAKLDAAEAEIARLTNDRDVLQYKLDQAVNIIQPMIVSRAEAAEAALAKAREENTRLRAALAMSDRPCVYCSLPAEEWAKCQSGFPGCDRADDSMGCPELGARLELDQVKAELAKAREALAEIRKIAAANPIKVQNVVRIKEIARSALAPKEESK